MSTRDDDRSVDRLLEAALRTRARDGAAAGPASSCVDAETIAAWADGALSVSAARAVETHLSTCARCQEIAAVFAQAAPPAPEAPAPWWRQVRFLTPALAGAAALALVVWTSIPGRDLLPATTPAERSQAQNEQTPQAGSATQQQEPQPQLQARADERAAEAASRAREDRSSSAAQRGSAADAKLARQRGLDELRDQSPSARPAPTGRATPPPPAAAAPPPPPAPAAPKPVAPPPQRTDPLPQPVVAGTAPPPGAVSERVLVDTPAHRAAAMVVVAEFSSALTPEELAKPGQAGAGGRGGRGGGGLAAGGIVGRAARQESLALNQPVRWRVLVSGVVEKSVDGGATWTPAAIDPPLPITGGAAPLPQVCWLIGRGGVVLRSIDGTTFTRVEFPEPVDLTSITARSALDATITSSSGRTHTTNDGGKTWR